MKSLILCCCAPAGLGCSKSKAQEAEICGNGVDDDRDGQVGSTEESQFSTTFSVSAAAAG